MIKFFICMILFTNVLFASPYSVINKEYATKFSKLLVQSKDGRIKPVDTQNLDLLNKLISKTNYKDISYNQVILGMTYVPQVWSNIELFELLHVNLQKLLHVKKKTLSFNDFYKGDKYLLEEEVKVASNVKESERNSYERALLKLDEKVKITKHIYTKGFMRIFPLKNSINDTWYSPLSLKENFSNQTKYEAQMLYVENKKAVESAIFNKDWTKAFETLDKISDFQKKYSGDVFLSDKKMEIELFYNKILLFEKLYPLYLLIGFILLVLMFIGLISKKDFRVVNKLLLYIVMMTFVAHTFGLGLRWYISEYAPWSNAYGSMLFISWCIVLAGLVFARKSLFALGSTAFLGGILLFVAHLNWIDPQIYTLAVNLQSYWLTIHVAVISASYGFLALSAMLGIITLILLVIDKNTNIEVNINIKESFKINEISMIIGLTLLTIGTLLGSVWANEAWGRIWGWDPKEAWSLISILIYMLCLHVRMIPNIFSVYLFSVLSVSAYSTIIMTYFGVNYFFDAIHVYAAKSGNEIPSFTYYIVASILILIMAAFTNRSYKCKN